MTLTEEQVVTSRADERAAIFDAFRMELRNAFAVLASSTDGEYRDAVKRFKVAVWKARRALVDAVAVCCDPGADPVLSPKPAVS